MKTAIVSSKDLQNNLSASAYVPPSKTTLREARRAGWDCGALGMAVPETPYWLHSHEEVRKAVEDALKAGTKAREEFLKSQY